MGMQCSAGVGRWVGWWVDDRALRVSSRWVGWWVDDRALRVPNANNAGFSSKAPPPGSTTNPGGGHSVSAWKQSVGRRCRGL